MTLPTGEISWYFKPKLALAPLRLQLLEKALAGAEGYEETEREVLRLFKDVRPQDPLARKMATDGNRNPPLLNRFLSQSSAASRPSSYAPSTACSAPGSFRSNSSAASQRSTQPFREFGGAPKQALASEMEENEPVETEEHEPETMDDETDLAEVLKCEAEALAAELDDAADLGIDAETLQEVEETVENAAEALVTMKEARTKLAEVKRDRGYGRVCPVEDKNKSNSKKQKSNCFNCGLPGRWAGDEECRKPDAKLGRKPKQVQIVEAMTTKHLVDESPAVAGDAHEVLTAAVLPLSQSLAAAVEESHMKPMGANLAAIGLTADKRLVGALDSACNRTCTGPDWLHGYLKSLQSAPEEIKCLVQSKPGHEDRFVLDMVAARAFRPSSGAKLSVFGLHWWTCHL